MAWREVISVGFGAVANLKTELELLSQFDQNALFRSFTARLQHSLL